MPQSPSTRVARTLDVDATETGNDRDCASRGPHPVGVRTIEISSEADPLDPARRLPVDLWYPAAPDGEMHEAAPHPLGQPHRADVDLEPAVGRPRPLVGFSHGNSGIRRQSTFLMTHLASWGFVVAAPEHVGNTFGEMLELEDEAALKDAHRGIRKQRPHDLAATCRALLDDADSHAGLPAIDATRVGVLGHSFGGWTALKAPGLEPRIRAVCGLAPVSEPFVGRKAFAKDELPLAPAIEVLVLAAADDVLVDLETSIRPLHERLGPNAQLEVIDDADHFHFCDGIDVLHKMHENTPRPGLPRRPRTGESLKGQTEMHAWLNERVTRFFLDVLR